MSRYELGAGKTYANNAVWADQLDQLVGDRAGGVALGIGLEVSEVTNVALLISWGTVVLALWVDCCDPLALVLHILQLWGVVLTVRAGGRAAVGVVTELVDVDATLSIGIVTGEVP